MGGIEPAESLTPQPSTAVRRWSPATRRCWPSTGPSSVRRGRRGRRRALLRGGRRRRHPDHPARCARPRRRPRSRASWASSTARPTTSSTRWTRRARIAEAARRRPGARLRRGRPDRRRRGLRRRREGRDPRLARVPHAGALEDVYREGITQVTAEDIAAAARAATSSSCSRSASGRRYRGGQRPGAPRPDAPRATRSRSPRTRTTRSSSRPKPRASSCSTGAARAGARPHRHSRGRRLGGPPPRARRPGAPSAPATPTCRAAHGCRAHQLPGSARRHRPPGVLAQVATVFAEHEVSIEAVRQTPVPRRRTHEPSPRCVFVTHRAPEPRWPHRRGASRGLDVVRAFTSVLRVEGVPEWPTSGAECSREYADACPSPTRRRSSRSARAARRCPAPRSPRAPAPRCGSSSRA